jgi:hypothetical protein
MFDEKNEAELLAIAKPISEALKQAGYEVAPPMPVWSANPSDRLIQINAIAHTGAGGMHQIAINVADDGLCALYVSPLFDVPPGKTLRDVKVPPLDVQLKTGTCDRDLVANILGYTRAAILKN